MKNYLARLFSLAVILLSINSAIADTLFGRVVGIADGDTVTVLDSSNTQFKIRLMGIDAPEKKQAFGAKSKELLSSLIFNREVAVEYSKKDRYGRTVGKITLDGVDINLEQIKSGMAWHYKAYQKEQLLEDQVLYAQAENEAQVNKIGLWRETDPVPPWMYRKLKH